MYINRQFQTVSDFSFIEICRNANKNVEVVMMIDYSQRQVKSTRSSNGTHKLLKFSGQFVKLEDIAFNEGKSGLLKANLSVAETNFLLNAFNHAYRVVKAMKISPQAGQAALQAVWVKQQPIVPVIIKEWLSTK